MVRLNIQQLPGDEEILQGFQADPEHKLVAVDWTSIEPVVQTVFSQDKAMWEIYGSGKRHDIYLFNGKAVEPDPQLRAELCRVYDTEGPDAAKEKFAKRRKLLYKPWTLAQSYGAGAGKWQVIAEKLGIELAFEDTIRAHEALKDLYSGMRAWDNRLYREWRQTGGWIETGLGRPRCVSPDVRKDLINIFTQTTAHDFHLWYVRVLDTMIRHRGVRASSWIDDFHDQTVWHCHEEDVDKCVQTFYDALDYVNEQLKWSLKIKGTVQVADNFAPIK